LPEETEFQISDYKPKLSLQYVSQPTMAVGVDRYGTYGGGGITLFWGDMMGYHSLATMAQVSSRLMDSAFLLGYQNNKHRFNWGAVAQRIPYVYGGFSQSLTQNQRVLVEQEFIFRQINYDLAAFVAYPFSRVSRFELSGGYRYIDFDQEVRTREFTYPNLMQLSYEKEKRPAPPGLHFGHASAALVYDSALFGATAPILGQSYRFEVSPMFGTINYYSVLADIRRYIVPTRPITLAFRFLHYGRYGNGAEDGRLYPMFLGYENLIRGYNYGSLKAGEGDIYNRLIGSKIMVANFELRFPLFGALGLGRGYYGIWPVDFIAFYDVGLAWYEKNESIEGWEKDTPWFLGGERKPLSSAGIGLRTNVFGFLVAGLNLVRPLNRPERSWIWQFTITPGF
jgi:hypothetical protein